MSNPVMSNAALPVAVDLADTRLSQDVCAHVESVLGWQVVRPGPHLPVRLVLADTVDPDVPTVVVTEDDDPEGWRTHLRQGARDVVLWPGDAARLAQLVPPPVAVRPADLVVAVIGTSSGVGATTVALALGAQHAWAGRPTLVLTDRDGMVLAGASEGDRPAGSVEVAGVRGLTVVTSLAAPRCQARPGVLVADRGVGVKGQVLVGVPDRALVAALTTAEDVRAVVTCGEGGLRPAELRRLLAGRRHVALGRSFRVARAGLCGRVPVGLPGSYLDALAPLARSEAVAA